MDLQAVKKAYARWAPVYDGSFGAIAAAGRRRAVSFVNRLGIGNVLEVGVGTGLSLPHYGPGLRVTGVDISPHMLARARERVCKERLTNVDALDEMDAEALEFPDGAFDIVVAMYLMSVVPDPGKVMAELERVVRPGGHVLIVNHFAKEKGVRAFAERALAPLSRQLGWRPDFSIDSVLGRTRLRLEEEIGMPPFGLFTVLRLSRPTNA